MKTDENALKPVKGLLTILEVCARLEMSRPTVLKLLKQRNVKPLQIGRGGKMWIPVKVLEAIENGS